MGGIDLVHELRGVYTLWLRDVKRFVRERVRIVGAVGQPLIYLAVMGTGFGATFRAAAVPEGFRYVEFMYPGIIGMTVLFTAMFSAVSIIWDREFGFLKEVLVAPVSRAAIVCGKALGGATVALLQGSLLLLLAPLVGVGLGPGDVLRIAAVLFVTALGLTALGLVMASRMPSMESFQIVMNFLVMPMWLLSGAFFPLRGAPGWMEALMRVDPLTYGVDALRGVIFADLPLGRYLVAHPYGYDLAVLAAVSAVCLGLALAAFRGREA